jgi:phosphoribosylamine--glycine ligase
MAMESARATVLVIGSGGREQALAWKLAQSAHVKKVYIAPGNGGSTGNIENVAIGFTDVPELLKFAQEKHIDLTVIGQEAASDAGAVDAFKAAGLTIFGPTKAATRLEASKVFSKDLMASEHIPTAAYQTFTDPGDAIEYATSRPLPVVIKADGLATGKGVYICATVQEIGIAITDIMVKKVFGESGDSVVVEDFLKGQEVSVHALCDGNQAVMFPASQDHKQVFDGDKGPNTGGMGVIAPVPWVTPAHIEATKAQIVLPALAGLQKRNTPFTGCLYPGLMIDGDDIKLLEFNARFGDPEAEVYMRLLDGDLYEVLTACAKGELDPSSIAWKPGFAVTVVLCSPGYPADYPKGLPITGIAEAEKLNDIVVFHAATIRNTIAGNDDEILTAGGRVLNVTATGPTLEETIDKAYAAVKLINFEGMHYRTDIGRRLNG